MMNFDEAAATELELWIINTGSIYRGPTQAAIRAIARKINKGTYRSDLARQAFYRVATIGAKDYHRVFDSPDTKYFHVFDVATRQEVADRLLSYYSDEIEETAFEMKKGDK